MSRRHSAEKREIIPDPKYGDVVLTKFMNSIMYEGKKSTAERIVYGAFDIVENRARANPIEVFRAALDNVAPMIEVRSRRVGGATYQVPVEVRTERRQALAIIGERTGKDPLEALEQSIKTLTPTLEVRSRRVGGATYQVPVEVRTERRQALAIRWLIQAARSRNDRTMIERLSAELLDAANNRGNAVKKREDTHRMAEANRAFSHYRW